MKLIIFDIDGTILDSVNADDDCFIKTFQDLYQIDLKNADWNNFKNVTDLGLTTEIFEKWLNRIPSQAETDAIKTHFYSLLKQKINDFIEIEDALKFINLLTKESGFEIGFATGGWRESAELKCNSIGLNLNEFIVKSSNDHFNRAKIIDLVITDALKKHSLEKFESITYLGDGLWDLKTTVELGIEFIGVDFYNSNKLQKAGVNNIINSYIEPDKIFSWINKKKTGSKISGM